MTTVVNIYNHPDFNPKVNPNDVYIGRHHRTPFFPGSRWRNPYKMDGTNKKTGERIKQDGTRAEVIEKYRQYILGKPCKTFDGEQPKIRTDLLAKIPNLKGKRLGCWCKPADCHGDLLAAWADNGIPFQQELP